MSRSQPTLAGYPVGPRTPEPFSVVDEARPPSPPRPRLRLKRRNVPHLSAPTQHFLASVAAADMPIPSIEEPEIVAQDSDMDETFHHYGDDDEDPNMLGIRSRAFSPPKTPVPGVVPSLTPSQYPNWSLDSFSSSAESSPEPECGSSRPSTSRSNQTSSSLFSRLSQFSDEVDWLSPEAGIVDKYLSHELDCGVVDDPRPTATSSSKRPRKAPWTKAMSAHLWSTYILYLQDPKVTPFRIGKSCIPPHGVCLRVAREAKRSWKGAKARARAPNSSAGGSKSGSSTPTAESSGTFMQWPHTCAATRAHLRELCRLKASTPGARGLHYMSRSPTPFTQAASRHWNRRTTPAHSSAFATRDIAVSLSVSASEAMQPQGPLAQLTRSSSDMGALGLSSLATPAEVSGHGIPFSETDPFTGERGRLGSPFRARSYGPSSSSPLTAVLGLPSSRQSHTVGARRTLQSPVRLSRSNTQKRRTRQVQEARKRPSLGSDLFTSPAVPASSGVDINRETEFSSTSSTRHDELFIPRIEAEPIMPSLPSLSRPSMAAPGLATDRLVPPVVPPRLGSPFPGSTTSFSFPNRLSQPKGLDFAALGRPFATVQKAVEPTPSEARTNLASRLAYIDQRLKDFNRGNAARRRSESPL